MNDAEILLRRKGHPMNRNRTSRLQHGQWRRRRAAILIIGALFATSACLLCALAVDVGHLAVSRGELQRSADAAALASAAVMLDVGDLNDQPDPATVAAHARTVAADFALLNPCRGVPLTVDRNENNSPDGDLVLGRYNSETGEFNPNCTRYNAAHILVRRDQHRNGPVPLIFGGLLGMPSVNLHREAAAFIENDIRGFHIPEDSLETSKLLPFSLQIDLWLDRASEALDQFTHDPGNQNVSSGPDGIFEISLFPRRLVPGNFGTVNLGSSANSAATLRRQILHGPNAHDFSYFPDNTIQLNDDGFLMLNGDTGVTASMRHELEQIIGEPRIIPLHATVSGQGNNAWFEVVAFVGITVLDLRLTGALHNRYIQIQPTYTCDITAIGGGEEGVTSRFVFRPPRLKDTD